MLVWFEPENRFWRWFFFFFFTTYPKTEDAPLPPGAMTGQPHHNICKWFAKHHHSEVCARWGSGAKRMEMILVCDSKEYQTEDVGGMESAKGKISNTGRSHNKIQATVMFIFQAAKSNSCHTPLAFFSNVQTGQRRTKSIQSWPKWAPEKQRRVQSESDWSTHSGLNSCVLQGQSMRCGPCLLTSKPRLANYLCKPYATAPEARLGELGRLQHNRCCHFPQSMLSF